MGIATQGWWCRSLQWFCDGDVGRYNGAVAPEIDPTAIVLGLCLVLAALLYVSNRPRRPR